MKMDILGKSSTRGEEEKNGWRKREKTDARGGGLRRKGVG